jgi:hypothetical protein
MSFLTEAVEFLIEQIKTNPDSSEYNNHLFESGSDQLFEKPDYSKIIIKHSNQLKKLKSFTRCDEFMHENSIVASHLDTLVGDGSMQVRMTTSSYLFHILERALTSKTTISDKENELNETPSEKLYKDLEELLFSDLIPKISFIPLQYFNSDCEHIDITEGISIDKMSIEQKEELSKKYSDIGFPQYLSHYYDYILTIRYEVPKILGARENTTELISFPSKRINQIVQILRLFKTGALGYSFYQVVPILDLPIKGGGTYSSIPLAITFGNSYILNGGEIQDLQHFWNKLKNIDLEKTGNKNLDIGIRRFNSAFLRRSNEDKLLDYFIAYEALFSKERDSIDSVSHKLGIRYARLMETDPKLRKDEFTKIKKLYKIRSKIVHGGQANIENSVLSMEECIRKALTKFLFMYIKPTQSEIIDELEFN